MQYPLRKPAMPRRGVTLIEVLATMLVATIGVFGVLALIPFATRQTQIGLNQEDALSAARNLQNRLEVAGYTDPVRWIGPDGFALPDPMSGFQGETVFCLDPIGVASGSGTNFPRADFVAAVPATFPVDVAGNAGITRLTVSDSQGNALVQEATGRNVALARRLFGHRDDVTFKDSDPVAELGLPDSVPQGKYIVDNSENPIRRETKGELDCMIFAVGNGATALDAFEYTFYTIVYLKRDTVQPSDRVYQITDPVTPATVLYGGGDIQYIELTRPLENRKELKRHNWVMLLSSNPSGRLSNLGFFKIQETYIDPGAMPMPEFRLTLQGGDYQLSGGGRDFMIHMPGVVAVYESTFRWEGRSSWNTF